MKNAKFVRSINATIAHKYDDVCEQKDHGTQEYKKDWGNKDSICMKVSADLQKVILLPKIDQFKVCVFTHLLVVVPKLVKIGKAQQLCGTRLVEAEKMRAVHLRLKNS
ncbi:hypothetical protein RRG08_053147 [Elysia crispata]|uniref:Uncharacterized protein n=1 Tax=Elysia crispata TaxID=231223 RepID=A0AAE1A8G8_9GAST|nr:hypothetical protein RRG08_053147 [Elysia crispata]